MSLLSSIRTSTPLPRLDSLSPQAAIPGGFFEVRGEHLVLQTNDGPQMPLAFFGQLAASLDMVRPSRLLARVPEGAISSDFTLRTSRDASNHGAASNALFANIGVPMAENLHLISNPCVDRDGNLYAMVSGPRGERVPVSIYRIDRDLQIRPFVRDLLNISALALGPSGDLFASSRAEGTVYRITPEGAISTFAEGMGVATGLAFDREGNLFVGDRSGTIFKINSTGEIFVFATLEPSVAAYHLCFRDDGTLLVTAPTTTSNQSIFAIAPDGSTSTFFSGLGRPQGMALDVDGNLYVAAALHGTRGIVRITPSKQAELFISGNDLVGLCFIEDGTVALATNNTLFYLDLGIEGRPLVGTGA
ncbi:SMP-30/gluconolactonase/LRE family protein [Granulicella cerasi]|uniref:SMP-30/gluconolactonase/LRE family protein n=1 Tax=Granulicella cerasi TaxID=741063 RepID=A0ABW1ZDS1_9BACT|nr:gluconolaconase [Granulicella cerasi]